MTHQALFGAVALALSLLAARCHPLPPPIDNDPPPPAPTVDPPEPGPADDCAVIDALLYDLQCRDEGGLPLWQDPIGRPYADYCRKELAKGVPWRTDCAAKITECSQLDAALKGEWCGDE